MRSHNPSLVAGCVFALLWFIQPLCSSAQDLEAALAHAKNVYAQQGPKAALPEYESLLAGYREVGDRRGEAITVGLIGNCYKHLGDYPKALELLKTALQIKRELGSGQIPGSHCLFQREH